MHEVVVKVRRMYVELDHVHERVSYSYVVLCFQVLLLGIYTKVDFIHFKEKDKNFNGNEIP